MAKDNDIAIKVSNVSKTFKLPHDKSTSLKSAFLNKVKQNKGYEIQEVLKDVSFEIKKGEFFGIVGRNGSGKSTLLKCMAGVYTPNKGKIQINGKLVPFIELGVGFNPELSGRDNVFLNGALLGFSRKQMEAMYDEIVEFAELEPFMDQKLKNYSSGMQVRLAFSIAIKAEGDVLLLDEVLAVGDEAFQRKCYDYFSDLKKRQRTVILVTHSMSAVEMYCTRAMLLEDGLMKSIGGPAKIAAEYSKSNDIRYTKSSKNDDKEGTDEEVIKSNIDIRVVDSKGKEVKSFTSGEKMIVELSWGHPEVVHAGVAIFRSDGQYIYGTNTYIEGKPLSKGTKSTSINFELDIAEGKYFLKAGVFGESDQQKIDFRHNGPTFIVNRDKDDYRWAGITKLKSEWK